MANAVVAELRQNELTRKVAIEIASGLTAHGDPGLLTIALQNLLGNAWKYTAKKHDAQIAFGRVHHGLSGHGGKTVYCIRDNGAGFDMAYADKLFAPFQRLHRSSEFAGNGIGLATVQRIISRHGGRIWAEAEVERGAAFFFTLGDAR